MNLWGGRCVENHRNNRRTLTMYADTGGSTRRNIMIVSHKFLLDRAYARRAEKAMKDFYSVPQFYTRSSDAPLNDRMHKISETFTVHPLAVQL